MLHSYHSSLHELLFQMSKGRTGRLSRLRYCWAVNRWLESKSLSASVFSRGGKQDLILSSSAEELLINFSSPQRFTKHLPGAYTRTLQSNGMWGTFYTWVCCIPLQGKNKQHLFLM